MARYLSVTVVLLTIGILVGETPAGASFSAEGSLSLPSFGAGVDLAWGDYDGDGDLDLLVAGDSGLGSFVTRLYRQDPGPVFTAIDPNLPGVNRGSVAWGDEDGDGDLDILLTGDNNGTAVSGIYLQTSPGVFTLKPTTILPVTDGEAAWGDYDSDGDQDVAVTGLFLGGRYSQVYRRNADGSYEWRSGIVLTGLSESDVSWVDTDNDGDPEIFLSGFDGSNYVSRLYRNDGNESFVASQNLTGVSEGGAAWCDYDLDGYIDLLLTGRGPTGGSRTTELYRNSFGTLQVEFFVTPFPALSQSEAAWGDYDNDGRSDIILSGYNGSSRVTTVYRNTGDFFTPFQVLSVPGLSGVRSGAIAWGDYTNDGRLDFVVAGETSTGSTTQFFRNTIPGLPPPVTGMFAGVGLHLDPPQFHFFNTAGRSVNLRIGRTPGGNERWPCLSASDGTRRVAAPGNIPTAQNFPFKPVPGGYYWSVQAVDASLRGSAFTSEQNFCVFAPVEGMPTDTANYYQALWGDLDGDGDPDLVYSLVDWSNSSNDGTYLQINNGGSLAQRQLLVGQSDTPGGRIDRTRAGDFDNDGDLDLVGLEPASGELIFLVNQGDATFTLVHRLCCRSINNLDPIDYDNDGDLDLFATHFGYPGYAEIFRLEDAFNLTVIGIPDLDSLMKDQSDWGDFDNDGDLDLVVTASPGSSLPLAARLLRNDGGSLVAVPSNITGTNSPRWADYDVDGDLDLAIIQNPGTGGSLKLYRNTGGSFEEVPTGIDGFEYPGSMAWGDLDANGRPELVMSGQSASGPRTQILEFEEDGSISSFGWGLVGVSWADRIQLVDYDVDGDLDIMLSGEVNGGGWVFVTYRNDCGPPNSAPTSPGNLNIYYPSGFTTTFTWNAGMDSETPSTGLSYNLRIGTTQTGNEIMSSMSQWNASPMTPSPRWVGGMGNVQTNLAWRVTLPPVPYFTWSVQSVDGGGVASPFASLEQVILGPWIYAVDDVPDDQGGQVEIRFGASHLDWSGETQYPVTEYRVWRQVAPGSWSLLETVPATQLPEYTVVAMTAADSSDLGLPMETFYVSAHTGTPSVTVESPPDSGYSVDNTAPVMPDGFAVAIVPSGISLGWLPSAEEDFRAFRIYRGDLPTGFTSNGIAAATLVHETTETAWIDPSGDLDTHYYELAAVDQAGNESPRATTLNQSGVGDRLVPGVIRLSPATPSPFRATTELHLTLDARRQVQVDVFDIGGRHVRTLMDGIHAEGRHVARWDGTNNDGHPAASGIYFVRMSSGSFRDVQRVVLRR